MNARSAKSFWTFSIRASLLVLILALLLTPPALAKKDKKSDQKPSDPNDLFNPLLGLDHSHWLVGPIAEIASLEEIREYLELTDDDSAQAFIGTFWESRAEGYGPFDKKPFDIYEARAAETDKHYSEGAFRGRRTARGLIFILYGEPEEVKYEIPHESGMPTLEAWHYPKDAAPGLSGESPKQLYRFVEIDGSKVLYTGQKKRIDPLRRRLNGNG
jgi:GWxTD domain-containing protein